MNLPDYSPIIQSLLADRDLNGLVAALRSPSDAGLRTQAARALGEMDDIDATESLIRSVLEDPEPLVKAAARQALQALHGNRSELVVASYRGGPPEVDEWLVEPEMEDFDPSIPDADIDGLLLVVSHESNPAIREKAIRALEHISDTRSTDMLVYLSLYSEDSSIRSAAREVLQAHFGDQAAEIIQAADANSDEAEEWSDEEYEETLAEDEDESLDDEYEEEAGEELEDDLDEGEFEPLGAARRPSDFPQGPSMSNQDRGSPVMQEVGIPWRVLVIVGIAFLIVALILLLKP